jgi:SSS family transporter
MDWIRSHALPLAFLAGYLILLAYHGWRGNRRSKALDDYLVGGRGMGGVVIALSFYATFVSSVTFVGHAGKSFTRGPAWWLTCVIVFTAMVGISWFVVAPPFMKQARQLGALTIPEFLGLKYRSNAVRRLSGIVVIAASLVYMVAVYDGAARSLEVLFAVDRHVIMIGIFLIVTLYTLSGGFHSVVATDAVQGVILFGGALLLPLMMVVRKGGLGPLLDSVRAANPTALDWTNEMPLVTMIGLALGVGLKLIVEPRQLSRFYGLASDQQLRRGRWIAPILLFVTYLCMLPVGFLAHAFVPRDASLGSDQIVPFLLGDGNVFGPIAGAFFLTALVAAAMSSLDSVLLVAASSVDHDVIGVRERSNPMLITRCWVLVLSAVAAGLALVQARGIVEMSSFSGSIYAACFLPSLVVGLFWKGGTRSGALAGIIVGFTVTTIWFYAKQLHAFTEKGVST